MEQKAPIASSYQGLNDVVGSAVAFWGLRAVSASYAGGPSIDVVDSAGANLTTINTLTSGGLDTTALTNFISGHGTASVTKIYDQIGTRHVTQGTVASMPVINTAPPTISKAYALQFTSAQSMSVTTANFANRPYTLLATAYYGNSGATTGRIIEDGNSNSYGRSSGTQGFVFAGGTTQNWTSSDNAWHQWAVDIVNGTTGNGITDATLTAITPGGTSNWGSNMLFAHLWVGYINEVIIWASDTSASASSLLTNQRNFWGF